jgi:N-acetylmuramoyl-L-alanine amidase
MLNIYENIGHWKNKIGKLDPGAIGPTGLRECDVNEELAIRVAHILREYANNKLYNIKVSGLKEEYLVDAVKNAKAQKCNMFISFHCNAAENPTAKGTEVWYAGNSELAKLINSEMVRQLNDKDRIPDNPKQPWKSWIGKFRYELKNRGTKEGGFYVISQANKHGMANALIELAFITNPKEEVLLSGITKESRQFLQQSAQAIADAIIKYGKQNGLI